jgi:hypothetical protein
MNEPWTWELLLATALCLCPNISKHNWDNYNLKSFEYRPGLPSQLLSQRGLRCLRCRHRHVSFTKWHQSWTAPISWWRSWRSSPQEKPWEVGLEKGRQILWIWIERLKNKQGTYIGTTFITLAYFRAVFALPFHFDGRIQIPELEVPAVPWDRAQSNDRQGQQKASKPSLRTLWGSQLWSCFVTLQ